MRIILFSGAFINAGDFLIEKRTNDLLKEVYPDADITILERNVTYESQIDMLNDYNLIVFGGGPGFQKKIYPSKIPFVNSLDRIKVPVAVVGWGWKGKNINVKTVYNHQSFSKETQEFIDFLNKSPNRVSCRDYYTIENVKCNGIEYPIMTGCPAWYDTEWLAGYQLGENIIRHNESISKIAISDAALTRNVKCMGKLFEIIRKVYPNAEIKLLLHSGIADDKKFLVANDMMKKYDYSYEDISGSAEGFKIYDDVDLHIGFRVHAHIYNLSHGNRTILINEDARGNGVNDALGLRNIEIDRYMESHIMTALHELEENGDIISHSVTDRIISYHEVMKRYLSELI